MKDHPNLIRLTRKCDFNPRPWKPLRAIILSIACAFQLSPVFSASASADILPATKVAAERLARFAEGHRSEKERKIIFVYFTPSDRTPPPDRRERLGRMMSDIQDFYAHEMERHGLGRRTIHFDKDSNGALAMLDVKGRMPTVQYFRSGRAGEPLGERIREESRPTLKGAGIDDSKDTIIYFCDVRTVQDGRVSGVGPYYGNIFSGGFSFGRCFFSDASILDPNLLSDKTTMLQDEEWGRVSLGRYNSIFIGGAAHETGHALGLPHDKERKDESERGTSLMGYGNLKYGEDRRHEGRGSFLTLADALRLASHPMFSGTERSLFEKPSCELDDLHASVRGGKLEVTGRIVALPEPYAIIAYNDPDGGGDYDATTWTAPLDAENRFTLPIGEFKAGGAELRFTVCLVNGANKTFRYPISADAHGTPDSIILETQFALQGAFRNWAAGKIEETCKLAEVVPSSTTYPPEVQRRASILAGFSKPEPKWPALDTLPPEVSKISLSRVAWQDATVGWGAPCRNHMPPGDTGDLPFLTLSGRYFEDGLYAHSPSRYVYDLDGKWKAFSAEAGMQVGASGSAIFVVKSDGKELYRSAKIGPGKTAKINADVSGAKILELVVEDAGEGKRLAWSIWCSPIVSR